MLGQQLVVFRMGANPDPKKTAVNRRGDCAVIGTNTRRPDFADFLESQRGMRKICLQQLKILVGEILNVRG